MLFDYYGVVSIKTEPRRFYFKADMGEREQVYPHKDVNYRDIHQVEQEALRF